MLPNLHSHILPLKPGKCNQASLLCIIDRGVALAETAIVATFMPELPLAQYFAGGISLLHPLLDSGISCRHLQKLKILCREDKDRASSKKSLVSP